MKECPGKILMISESPFPEDRRVRNEAYTLAKAGYRIRFISLNTKPPKKSREEMEGVIVYRIPQITLFNKGASGQSFWKRLTGRLKSFSGYILEYVYFTTISFLLSLYIALRHGFDCIHMHNPPNTLVFIGMFFKIFGKKYVFDHHDLAPELFLSKYNVNNGPLYQMLRLEEILCLKSADLVIATNESYKRIDLERGKIKEDKVVIVRNGPDLHTFQAMQNDNILKKNGKTLLVYLGVIGVQDGGDYMIRALHHLAYTMGRKDYFCIVIGPGDALEDLKELARKLKLEDHVRFTGFMPSKGFLSYLSAADICLDPNPSSPFNDFSTCIKVMEYMAMGKPVVSFDLPETRFTAQQASIYVPPNDEIKYAEAIEKLMDDPVERTRMGTFGLQRIRNELAWKHVSKNLVSAYQGIFAGQAQ